MATTYSIGREPDPRQPRIVLEDKSISRKHGTISDLGNGKFVLEDGKSQNGTFIREKGGWRRIERADVLAVDEVRLGMFITTVGDLMRRAVVTPGRVKVTRNPLTGEIETGGT